MFEFRGVIPKSVINASSKNRTIQIDGTEQKINEKIEPRKHSFAKIFEGARKHSADCQYFLPHRWWDYHIDRRRYWSYWVVQLLGSLWAPLSQRNRRYEQWDGEIIYSVGLWTHFNTENLPGRSEKLMRKLDFYFLLPMPGEIVSVAASHSSQRDILIWVGQRTMPLMRFPEQKRLREDFHSSIKIMHCSVKFLDEQSCCLRKQINMHDLLSRRIRLLMIFPDFTSLMQQRCEQRDWSVEGNSRDVIKIVMNTEHLFKALRMRFCSLRSDSERARSCDSLDEDKMSLSALDSANESYIAICKGTVEYDAFISNCCFSGSPLHLYPTYNILLPILSRSLHLIEHGQR